MQLESQTYDIKQVSEILDISVSAVRTRIKDKTIPAPMKRKGKKEPLKWRKSDILNFVRPYEDNKPDNSIDTMLKTIVEQMVEDRVIEILSKKGVI